MVIRLLIILWNLYITERVSKAIVVIPRINCSKGSNGSNSAMFFKKAVLIADWQAHQNFKVGFIHGSRSSRSIFDQRLNSNLPSVMLSTRNYNQSCSGKLANCFSNSERAPSVRKLWEIRVEICDRIASSRHGRWPSLHLEEVFLQFFRSVLLGEYRILNFAEKVSNTQAFCSSCSASKTDFAASCCHFFDRLSKAILHLVVECPVTKYCHTARSHIRQVRNQISLPKRSQEHCSIDHCCQSARWLVHDVSVSPYLQLCSLHQSLQEALIINVKYGKLFDAIFDVPSVWLTQKKADIKLPL